jgi:hypothetical protein
MPLTIVRKRFSRGSSSASCGDSNGFMLMTMHVQLHRIDKQTTGTHKRLSRTLPSIYCLLSPVGNPQHHLLRQTSSSLVPRANGSQFGASPHLSFTQLSSPPSHSFLNPTHGNHDGLPPPHCRPCANCDSSHKYLHNSKSPSHFPKTACFCSSSSHCRQRRAAILPR